MLHPIAIHLPQFHPVPENDEWWGKGFTEWTNVSKTLPKFTGHYQPHLPADLGFYDLRLEESRVAQAELAQLYGIEGFCYYHYWFNGKRLLQRPLDDMIKTQTPDFPFMLCWANENWSRRWDGADHEVLIKQDYSSQDDAEHIYFLINNFFSDKRYIRVNNKPFFLVYRPKLFPNIKATTDLWRNEAMKAGAGELYLGYIHGFGCKDDPESLGFDCAIEFQPDFASLPTQNFGSIKDKVLHKSGIKDSVFSTNKVISYAEYVNIMIAKPAIEDNVYPGVSPGWDNSARRKSGATIFVDSSPEEYERWLISINEKYKSKETFLFINAWNEWAEGNHLEPCTKWGRKFLEATKMVLKNDILDP